MIQHFFIFLIMIMFSSNICIACSNPSLSTLLTSLKNINEKLAISQTSQDLIDQKEHLLKAILTSLADKKNVITPQSPQTKKDITALYIDPSNDHDRYTIASNALSLANMELDWYIQLLLEKIYHNTGIFSSQMNVIEITTPALNYLKSLEDPKTSTTPESKINKNKQIETSINLLNNAIATFEAQHLDGLSIKQQDALQQQYKTFLFALTTYIEMLEYINKNTDKILPQRIMFELSVQTILNAIQQLLPNTYSHILFAKILLSAIAFLFLWFCRKILTKLIIGGINLILHFTKQNNDTNTQIQKSLIKPISIFLLFVSINITLNILYYPTMPPQNLEVWFWIAYIINATWFIIAALQSYVAAFLINIIQNTEHFRKEVINLFLKAACFIIIVIAALMILKVLGFNISTIVASLGLGGLAVALAVKDILANFFASVMLLFDNSFSHGERIECGGIDGVVVEMGLRRTTIRTSDNALVLIPNSELANKSIINWSRRKVGRLIKLTIGLTYDTSSDKIVECAKAIKTMLLTNPNIAKSSDKKSDLDSIIKSKKNIISFDDYLGYKNQIYVVLDTLGDSSINILVYCFSKAVHYEEYLLTKENVILEILRIIEAHNLSLAFPTQSIYIQGAS